MFVFFNTKKITAREKQVFKAYKVLPYLCFVITWVHSHLVVFLSAYLHRTVGVCGKVIPATTLLTLERSEKIFCCFFSLPLFHSHGLTLTADNRRQAACLRALPIEHRTADAGKTKQRFVFEPPGRGLYLNVTSLWGKRV